jgi:aminoglycoside phosphotransferase (APT) family kinase protein
MIFHPTEPRVIAVLDWELSTLGDPMADFTYLLMQWVMEGLRGADLARLNIPTLEEAADIYCGASGRPSVPDINWYLSYNLFRGPLWSRWMAVLAAAASAADASTAVTGSFRVQVRGWRTYRFAGSYLDKSLGQSLAGAVARQHSGL